MIGGAVANARALAVPFTTSFVGQSIVTVGTSSVNIAELAGWATGDAVFMFVAAKGTVATTPTVVTPAGWTKVCEIFGGFGDGDVASGFGPTLGTWFFREKDAGWTTCPTLTVTNGNACAGFSMAYSKSGGAWSVASATGLFGNAASTASPNSVLTSNPGITEGDRLLCGMTNERGAVTTWSNEAVTVPGATHGAVTIRSDVIETDGGADCSGVVFDTVVSLGSASGAPAVSADLNSPGCGTAALVRLRAA